MLTPSNVLELHLSTISCSSVERDETIGNVRQAGIVQMEFSMREKKKGDVPEEPDQTAVSRLGETARSRIVQCVLSPLNRI